MPKTKKKTAPNESLRETFFGDMPLANWASASNDEPWASFKNAVSKLEDDDQAGATRILQSVVQRPGLESRHYLQAWSGLRELGESPSPGQAKHVYGVVVDVPVESGLDTLAAYEDGTARYINYAGAVIIWEAPDGRLKGPIEKLLSAGQTLARLIGPWDGARPALPPDLARISLLTPTGLHFGQAPFEAFLQDGMAAPLISAATELMQALVELSESAGES
jgi:hypothetical protein